MSLARIEFEKTVMKLKTLYQNQAELERMKANSSLVCTPEKIREVYGELFLPKPPENRPYIFASYVFSLDGKIGFVDNPVGTLISEKNLLDPDGGLTDFWFLNVLRAYSDIVVLGAKTLKAEANLTAHIYDQDLINTRIDVLGKHTTHPVNLIISSDGRSIPLNHDIFDYEELITWICTSPAGVEYLKENWDRPFSVIIGEEITDSCHQTLEKLKKLENNLVICTGHENKTDSKVLLQTLRYANIEHVLVEPSSYTWLLMREKCLDELFINYSGLYAGGDITFGLNQPFTSEIHPHSQIIKLDIHRSNFLFSRQRLVYDLK